MRISVCVCVRSDIHRKLRKSCHITPIPLQLPFNDLFTVTDLHYYFLSSIFFSFLLWNTISIQNLLGAQSLAHYFTFILHSQNEANFYYTSRIFGKFLWTSIISFLISFHETLILECARRAASHSSCNLKMNWISILVLEFSENY